jgi:hypothetical protein
MNELTLANRAADWHRLKSLVLDPVSSPITKRVYNLGLDEFFAWYGQEPRPGFTKATVAAWRVALEARGLGSVSINVRITAVRKLAVEAADNGLLAPQVADMITMFTILPPWRNCSLTASESWSESSGTGEPAERLPKGPGLSLPSHAESKGFRRRDEILPKAFQVLERWAG